MAYKVIILYRLYMPSYFLGTFTEYPILNLKRLNSTNTPKQDQKTSYQATQSFLFNIFTMSQKSSDFFK